MKKAIVAAIAICLLNVLVSRTFLEEYGRFAVRFIGKTAVALKSMVTSGRRGGQEGVGISWGNGGYQETDKTAGRSRVIRRTSPVP